MFHIRDGVSVAMLSARLFPDPIVVPDIVDPDVFVCMQGHNFQHDFEINASQCKVCFKPVTHIFPKLSSVPQEFNLGNL